jgi:uncharacterized protein (TIGR00369 family)
MKGKWLNMSAEKSIPRELLAATAFFGSEHPLFGALGVSMDEITQDGAVMSMPCVADVCDHDGVLHRGAIATLLDTACGLAIFVRLGDMRPIATIDLRVDFITMPKAGEGVFCNVMCFAVEGNIAYVRGEAFGRVGGNLLASVSGSFAIGTAGPSFDQSINDGQESNPSPKKSSDAISIKKKRESVSVDEWVDDSPYVQFLGITALNDNGVKNYKMPFREQHIGNPLIKTFHGGIIASFAEIVAECHLIANQTVHDKPICSSMTFDYLRPAFAGTLMAEPKIIREGKRFIVIVVDVFRDGSQVSRGRFIYKRVLTSR